MGAATPPVDEPVAGVSGAVLAAALVAALAVLPVVPVFVADELTSPLIELAAWPPLAVAGAVILDRHPEQRPAWGCVGLSLLGWVMVVVASLDQPEHLTRSSLEQTVVRFGPWPALVTMLVLGALFVPARNRLAGRRRFWMFVVVAIGATSVTTAWSLPGGAPAGAVSGVTVWMVGLAVAALMLADSLRPVDEPLLDVGLGVAVVVATTSAGLLTSFGGRLAGLNSAEVLAAFAAVSAGTLAVPGALWLRRTVLMRRYGSGILHPHDVAAITKDLDGNADPRALLGKAAAMVASASGSHRVEIILGDDQPDSPHRWTTYALVVGSGRVGTLLVVAPHPEGPERRQQRVIGQLLPTVALVAQAVTLAVEAEHARRDVSREREAAQARILADLHDDLGPVLAGMSMRVEAARRQHPEPWLDDLANDLTAARADLRRIVSGLIPSALDEDLATALDRLVAPYRQPPAGPHITVVGTAPSNLTSAASATIYRTVAEGVTNAARHAQATGIVVLIDATASRLRVEVTDDGVGGPLTPGVGLTSLRRRAEDLGGTLTVSSGPERGIRLILDLPWVAA